MKDNKLIFGLMAAFRKKEYSFSDLSYLCNPFNVTESSLRTNLSRISQKGLIITKKEGKNGYYSLTEKGNIIINNFAKGFNKLDWSKWDKSFWGIIFSIPESKKEERHKIRKKLKYYRFAPLYPGFWIRPYNPIEKIDIFLKNIFKNENCKIIKFLNYKDFKKNEINKLWNLNNINNGFIKGLNIINKKKETITNISPEDALKERMYTGEIIIKQLFKDPLIPDNLLPEDWKGDELKKEFKLWDKITTEKSKPYWKKIFK